jgi:hypothetical protein
MRQGNSTSSPDKAFDTSTSSDRVVPVASDRSYRVTTPVALIAAAQNYTSGTWADLGPEVNVDGYTQIGLWVSHVNNQNTGTMFRALAKHTSADTNEYTMPPTFDNISVTAYSVTSSAGSSYVTLTSQVDQKLYIPFEVFNTIPILQFQCQSFSTGSSVGNVASAYLTMGWK